MLPISANADDAYGYDGQGRVKSSCHTHLLDGQRTDYNMDPAGNRSLLNSFQTNFTINAGSGITSADGRFNLFMQNDGNLVLYQGSVVLWLSQTAGLGGIKATMQHDGNFVIYTAAGSAVWQSSTNGNFCSQLVVQNDGNVVIYDLNSRPVWYTSTGGH